MAKKLRSSNVFLKRWKRIKKKKKKIRNKSIPPVDRKVLVAELQRARIDLSVVIIALKKSRNELNLS